VKKNIKKSRIYLTAIALLLVFLIPSLAKADLNKYFRKNFNEINQASSFNTITYNVDDLSGFELVEVGEGEDKSWEWRCIEYKEGEEPIIGINGKELKEGKCLEYRKRMNCLVNNTMDQAIREINEEVRRYVDEDLTEQLESFRLPKRKECVSFVLGDAEALQYGLGFKSTCDTEGTEYNYSSCKLAEVMLNELRGYKAFLLAKQNDYQSFSHEKLEYDGAKTIDANSFDSKVAKYKKEQKKAEKTLLDTILMYKNFVHNYKIHAWMVALNHKLSSVSNTLYFIKNGVETFPAKFVDATTKFQ